MSALVATERHLWLNLSGIQEKQKTFLLDAPIATSGLFGKAVDAVVNRFQHARTQGEAFRQYLPRRSGARMATAVEGRERAQPSSSSYHQTQRQSVASRAPPQHTQVSRRRSHPQPPETRDLRTILQSRRGRGKRS